MAVSLLACTKVSHSELIKFTNPASAEGAERLGIRPVMCPSLWLSSSLFQALLMVYYMGMPLPIFTETAWVSDCLIPCLLGITLRLSCEKLPCSEKDHRLRHYTLTFSEARERYQHNLPSPFFVLMCSSLCEQARYSVVQIKVRNTLPAVNTSRGSFCSSLPHGGLTRSLSQMAVRLSVTVIRLSLIPAGEA